ncbi:MAG TPA: hypothetical protein VLI94_00595 [Solirubrobacterales bacterium]|nr:hypothetical protein [Solirubrobacterales bacterium]
MRFKFITAALTAVLSISLLGATGASAATQAGSNCLGNNSAEGITLYGAANAPGSPLPAAIPVSGVVTRWTFNVVPIPPGVFSAGLKILRPTGLPGQLLVAGEAPLSPVAGGLSTFSTRIPVRAGDLLGTFGSAGGEAITIYCETASAGDRMGVIIGNPPLGSTAASVEEVNELQVPITVSVEPDADNDGFGDETQDACPQSATTQAACPPVALSTSKQVNKGSVTIVVTSSTAAPVTVKGIAGLGKGKKAKLNGGTQNLVPGTLSKFRLFFPKALKNKLKELPPKRKLTLNVTVTGTSVSGAVTTKTLKVKLKGQAKG